jgi:hypothetical protein
MQVKKAIKVRLAGALKINCLETSLCKAIITKFNLENKNREKDVQV